MTISAPSTEHTESVGSSGSPHDRRPAWGQKARRPSLSKRLARTYDWCIEKFADRAEYLCIATFAGVPVALSTGIALMIGEPFWMLMIPLCGGASYITAMQSVTMLSDKIKERDERIAEINDSALYQLCEARKDVCDTLQAELSQLEHDKAWLLCERGQLLRRLHEAEEAAAEKSRSENQEDSAAVVHEFPKGA